MLPITVVIPTCNSEKTLGETLESLFVQSHPASEIIVVDDASSDGTREILAEHGSRIRVILRDANSGSADIPRYQGVKAAKTDWVAFLDGDDLWDENKLKTMGQAIGRKTEIPLWHHYVRVIDVHSQGSRIRHEGSMPPTGWIGPELLRRCFICTSSVVVKRNAWLAAQVKSQLGGYGTEWDFFLAIAREHPIGFVGEVLGSYRYADTSISRKNWKRFSRDVVGMQRIYGKDLWKGVVSRREMNAIMLEAFREDADLHRYNGHPGHSLWFCLSGMRYRPLDAGLWVRVGKAIGRLKTED